MKKNWFVIFGILIVLSITAWDVSQVHARTIGAVQECNTFWREQTHTDVEEGFFGDYNLTIVANEQYQDYTG